jgi:hypothetical protein
MNEFYSNENSKIEGPKISDKEEYPFIDLIVSIPFMWHNQPLRKVLDIIMLDSQSLLIKNT